jgi:insecticidal toxin complex protein TccC
MGRVSRYRGGDVDFVKSRKASGTYRAEVRRHGRYDLFGLFPRVNRGNNDRPINPVARLVGRNVQDDINRRAKAYLNRLRQTRHPLDRDAVDLGNIHHYGKTIINALNVRISQHGYRGGLLVHHGDESSNPFSPGQDFPLRFVVPEKPAMFVENNEQLERAYRWFRQLGYSVDINPAFSFPSWRRRRI